MRSTRHNDRRAVLTSGIGGATPDPDACPECGKRTATTLAGLRRIHKDRGGAECLGSGTRAADVEPFRLDELPPIVMPTQGARPGENRNKWG